MLDRLNIDRVVSVSNNPYSASLTLSVIEKSQSRRDRSIGGTYQSKSIPFITQQFCYREI